MLFRGFKKIDRLIRLGVFHWQTGTNTRGYSLSAFPISGNTNTIRNSHCCILQFTECVLYLCATHFSICIFAAYKVSEDLFPSPFHSFTICYVSGICTVCMHVCTVYKK
jgi:hypothetical protein